MAKQIPGWIQVWGVLVAILCLGHVLVAYFHPQYYGHDWSTVGTAKYGDVYGLYVSRNLAMGLVTLLAVVQRHTSGLIIVFALRIATDVVDSIHAVVAGTVDTVFVVAATMLIVVSGWAIVRVRRLDTS